jgi:hypothetical protein
MSTGAPHDRRADRRTLMAEQRRDTPHSDRENPENERRTRWGKILLPLTTIAFLAVFIVAMLVIYALAQ